MTTKSGSAVSSNDAARYNDGIAREQTSRVEQLRSLLGTSEGFLTTVVENIPAVVFAKDAHTGRFVLVNRAGEEFLGVPRSTIIGKTDHEVFAKEEADRFVARDLRALQSRQPQVSRKSRSIPRIMEFAAGARGSLRCAIALAVRISCSASRKTSPSRSSPSNACATWRITTG